MSFRRTKSGLEIDFIPGDGEVALEVKGSDRIDSRELRALRVFSDESKPRQAILVSRESEPRIVGGIQILPWRVFLERLWSGKIIA